MESKHKRFFNRHAWHNCDVVAKKKSRDVQTENADWSDVKMKIVLRRERLSPTTVHSFSFWRELICGNRYRIGDISWEVVWSKLPIIMIGVALRVITNYHATPVYLLLVLWKVNQMEDEWQSIWGTCSCSDQPMLSDVAQFRCYSRQQQKKWSKRIDNTEKRAIFCIPTEEVISYNK